MLTVGDIVEPMSGDVPNVDAVTRETTLEELMPHLAAHNDGLGVKDADGNIVGRVTPHGVIAALASSEDTRGGDAGGA